MDYGKLARVNDDLNSKVKVVSGKGLEVEEPTNPLDALALEQPTVQKQKLLILDNAGIKAIMAKPREERRKILSRLSDSQRRRVLQMAKQTKIQDSVTRLELLQIDELLSNAYFEPTEYNLNNLKEAIDFIGEKAPIWLRNEIIPAILDGNFNREELTEQLESYNTLCEELNIASMFLDVITSEVTDSVKDFIKDSVELTEDFVNKITEDVKKDIESWDKKDFNTLNEAAEDTIARYVQEGLDYNQVNDLYWDTATVEYNNISNQLLDSRFEEIYGLKINDLLDKKDITDALQDALNTIEEKPYIDNTEVEEKEDKNILQTLGEAIEAYVNGNEEPLQALANTTIEQVSVEHEDEQVEEEVIEEPEDVEDDEVQDAVAFAKSVIARAIDATLLDRLSDKVSVLKKYNFKVSDCAFGPYVAEPSQLLNMPMTCSEFNALNKKPLYFDEMLAASDYPRCPYVDEFIIPEDHRCLIVNGSQSYYPHSATLEEVNAELASTENPQEWTAIVNKYCCPLESAFALASKTDNLNFIDNRFYKRKFDDESWTFDEKPEFLQDVDCSGLRYKTDSQNGVDIYGQTYELL